MSLRVDAVYWTHEIEALPVVASAVSLFRTGTENGAAESVSGDADTAFYLTRERGVQTVSVGYFCRFGGLRRGSVRVAKCCQPQERESEKQNQATPDKRDHEFIGDGK